MGRPRPTGRDRVVVPLRTAVVCFAAYVAGTSFTSLFHAGSTILGGVWSVVSGIVVLQATLEDTRGSAMLRVLGTLIGATVAAIYIAMFRFDPLGMAVCVGITVLFCQSIRVPDHARLAAVTVVIVLAVSVADPTIRPALNALLRFVESCIGAGIATLAMYLTPGARRRPAAG
jgi:uncharacterized membrane protein YgaE (UPF0421/DUF939 family)